jgi:hypothetical protein
MKALFVLSLALLAAAGAQAAKINVVPNGPCEIETQEGYITDGQNETVYMCQNGVWTYFYTRSAKKAQFAAFAPGSECRLEGQRKYVKTSATTDDVYVCEAGAWQYLFTRDSSDNQD